LTLFLLPGTKVNTKWIKDLNGKPETLKFLKENRDTIEDTGIGIDFLK
jgi:hypothetical protein